MSAAANALVQRTASRSGLVLIVLFGVTTWLLAQLGPTHEAAPRWPTAGATYAADGWTVSPPTVDESRPGLAMVTHTYNAADAATRATVVVSSSPIAKAIYRAGAAVPFLGNGYTVESLPASGHRDAFIARRGDEAWLQVSVYGERRGQFGSGAVAWALSTFDSLTGVPNDYYLARVVVPYTPDNLARATALADTLFPRFATYYGNAT